MFDSLAGQEESNYYDSGGRRTYERYKNLILLNKAEIVITVTLVSVLGYVIWWN